MSYFTAGKDQPRAQERNSRYFTKSTFTTVRHKSLHQRSTCTKAENDPLDNTQRIDVSATKLIRGTTAFAIRLAVYKSTIFKFKVVSIDSESSKFTFESSILILLTENIF